MADKEPLETRAQKAIIQEAFFRAESALILALTILMTAAAGLNLVNVNLPLIGDNLWLPILAGGIFLEALILYSSITDEEFGRQVVEKLLRQEFKPERLQDKSLQRRMQEALDYRSRIENSIRQQDSSMVTDELLQTAGQIDDWLANMYDLALKIDRYQQEKAILERDRTRAESRLAQLKREYSSAQNPAVKSQMELTIEGLQRQLQILDTLDGAINRARLQLENSLTHLGTIYSQTMLVDAKGIDRARARRLRQEIADEVTELNDILVTMDDVYATESAF
ncbi:MAG: hypothetical protein GY796_20955 [Chloroflexi bacterium]|nr:hypothetical protein [Chloroflexota bacterium]